MRRRFEHPSSWTESSGSNLIRQIAYGGNLNLSDFLSRPIQIQQSFEKTMCQGLFQVGASPKQELSKYIRQNQTFHPLDSRRLPIACSFGIGSILDGFRLRMAKGWESTEHGFHEVKPSGG